MNKLTSPTDAQAQLREELTRCVKKGNCGPIPVKIALGDVVIVGDQVDFIQRVVVDTSVTSQEVTPSVLTTATAELSSDKKTITVKGTGLANVQSVSINGTPVTPDSSNNTQFQLTVPSQVTAPIVVQLQTTNGQQISISVPSQ